jgi:hypothetical protein
VNSCSELLTFTNREHQSEPHIKNIVNLRREHGEYLNTQLTGEKTTQQQVLGSSPPEKREAPAANESMEANCKLHHIQP